MAESQFNPTPTTSSSSTCDVLPDIASTCPFCKLAFHDSDFASLIWLDDHTPAHLTCFNEQNSNEGHPGDFNEYGDST